MEEDGTRVYGSYKAPEFHAAKVFKTEDFKSFMDTYVFGCKIWKDGATQVNIVEMYRKYPEAR